VNDCPLVLIEWEDSALTEARWHSVEEAKRSSGSPVKIASVGWLLKNGKKAKTLAASVGGLDGKTTPQCSGLITIPASAIISTRKLS
jgi:hypothetical protein